MTKIAESTREIFRQDLEKLLKDRYKDNFKSYKADVSEDLPIIVTVYKQDGMCELVAVDPRQE